LGRALRAAVAVLLGIGSSAALAIPGAGDTGLTSLLSKAAERLAGPEVSAYFQREKEEDLSSEGRVTAVRLTRTFQTLRSDGSQHGEVIEAIENGENVLEKVRKFRADRERESRGAKTPPLPLDLEFRLPFDASQRGRYIFTRVGGSEAEPRIHFQPAVDPKRLWVGEATLDAATGTILQLQGHPAVLPMFVDQIDISMEFNPGAATGALPARLVIEGGAHFLFFHKRMRYTSITNLPDPSTVSKDGTPLRASRN
jgi:hypothetical protein